MVMTGHLDAEAIYELLEGRVEAARARAAEAHLWRCAACRAMREECAAGLAALRWYGQASPPAPAGYWESFWRRWPVAGAVRPPGSASRRFRRVGRALAAAAVAALAVGTWWRWPDAASEKDLASLAPAAMTASVSTPDGDGTAAREAEVAGGWENDVQILRQVSFPIGSVDPLSKGVVLASLAEQP